MMTESNKEINQLVINIPDRQNEGIDLFELLRRIWNRKFWIVIPTFFAAVIIILIVLFVLPERYISKAVIQILDSPYKNRLTQMTVNDGLTILSDPEDNTDFIRYLYNHLNSTTYKEKLINDFNILQDIYPELWDDERKIWKVKDQGDVPNIQKEISRGVIDDRYDIKWNNIDKLFQISFIDKSPTKTQEVVGGILLEIKRYIYEYRKMEIKKHREFLEFQREEIRNEMVFWENQASDETTGSTKVPSEIEALKMVYAECRLQLSIAKVEENHLSDVLTVLDEPTYPIRVSPKRGRICTITVVISFFTAIIVIFFLELTLMIHENRKRR